MRIRTRPNAGLTLVEGVVVLVIILGLAGFYLAAVSRGYTRSDGVRCVNQLKQVGLAFRLWANDHGDQLPFAAPAPGGSSPYVNTPQVFRHFQVISNELVTPKLLVCPTDKSRSVAGNFTALLNTNISCFVGLDAHEQDPRQMISGDRNITGGAVGSGYPRVLTRTTEAGWTSDLHENSGNIALVDMSVHQFSTNDLRKHLASMTNAAIRLAVP